jgi:hypothetical protein
VVDKVRLHSVMVIPYNQRRTADIGAEGTARGLGHSVTGGRGVAWSEGGRRGELCRHHGRKSPRGGKMNIFKKKLFTAQIIL